jgi:hypothetical protein
LKSVPGVDVVYIAGRMSLVAMPAGSAGLQGNNLVVLHVACVRSTAPSTSHGRWEHIAVLGRGSGAIESSGPG